MKSFLSRFFLFVFSLFVFPLGFALSAYATPVLWIAEIRGTINPASSSYLRSAIQQAEANHAEALIVELDTPGGLLASVREMAQVIDKSQIPVIVYVTPAGASATSAGALLMLASHFAVMAPGTHLGAAHPVGPQGEEIKGTMGEKVVSDTAAFARGLAELRGRNRELAEKVVSKSRSFTAEEALKEKLIELIAPQREDLLNSLHQMTIKTKSWEKTLQTTGATLKLAEMSAGLKLLNILANPNIAAILMTLGMLLIYMELSNPGITIAGVLGGICLLTAFIALQLLPIHTGGLALLILGIILMAAEVFVTAHGVLAIGGILSFTLGMLWIIDPSKSDLKISPFVWGPAVMTLGGGITLLALAAARMRKLSQKTLAQIGGAGKIGGLAGYEGIVKEVEESGKMGKALIRGELWNFHSTVPVKKGDRVEILQVEGMSTHVRPLA